MKSDEVIAVVGSGYVGLPLAVEFGKIQASVGFDLSTAKINRDRNFIDATGGVTADALRSARHLILTDDPAMLVTADYILVAVPTPVDAAHVPHLHPLVSASETVGRHMKPGATVIYESTVYSGATEEVCIPVLERFSGLTWKDGFHVGFYPERINPGDNKHTLKNVVKVVTGGDATTLARIASLYELVVEAGIHRASSPKEAKAANVIENTQRDLNIALMNEVALIFDKIGIDTLEVLEAAGPKWNFLQFRPGLVGGHCIGVDPYYLTQKAETLGYQSQVILAERRINDGMAKFVADKAIKSMIAAGFRVKGAKIHVIGLTFKEDCPDLRNSTVADIVFELRFYGIDVHVHDPLADPDEAKEKYGIELEDWNHLPKADALIMAVAHQEVLAYPLSDIQDKRTAGGCFMDVKAKFNAPQIVDAGYVV